MITEGIGNKWIITKFMRNNKTRKFLVWSEFEPSLGFVRRTTKLESLEHAFIMDVNKRVEYCDKQGNVKAIAERITHQTA